jgi:ParB-like chromosome segregation protein Spo0J
MPKNGKKKPERSDPKVHPARVVDVGSVKPHPKNYRRHPEEQLRHLGESLKQHGLYKNIVTAEDGTILAGHGIHQAALLVGMRKIMAVALPIAADSPRALKIVAADNKLPDLADDDDAMLAALLVEVQRGDVDGLLGTGYDDEALAAMLLATAPAQAPDDFPVVDENVPTKHECPKCGYAWS